MNYLTSPAQTDCRRRIVDTARCVVVKVGTRVLTQPDGRLDVRRVGVLAEQLCRVAATGRQTILVSSGAVGAGVAKLKLSHRPADIATLQAVAAIGQADLMAHYESAFQTGGRHAAQVLLTARDLADRSGYLHVRNALAGVHRFGAIAVVNENDTVAVAELETTFGDNDQLAAQVAGLFNDAVLILLTDVDALYDGHPADTSSQRIDMVTAIDDSVMSLAQTHLASDSKGGMDGKLRASRLAGSAGHPTVIASGRDDTVIDRIMAADTVGTWFLPPAKTVTGRRRWIAAAAGVGGTLTLDAGATAAVRDRGKSLLAVGVVAVAGDFGRGDVVRLIDPGGTEIGRGLIHYTADEMRRIAGLQAEAIEQRLGHRPYAHVVHRDNLVIYP